MSNQDRPAVYAAATQLTAELVDAPAWALHEAEQRVSGAIKAPGPFAARWSAALHGAAERVGSAAGRALQVHLLFPSDIAVATKRELVGAPPHEAAAARDVPEMPDEALGGVAPTGVASRLRRLSQVAYILRATAYASGQDDTLWTDAAACRRWLHSVPAPGAGAQREALAHLLHPQAFEPIASPTVKARIRRSFAAMVSDAADDDAALQEIRQALVAEFGASFRFTDPGVRTRWDP